MNFVSCVSPPRFSVSDLSIYRHYSSLKILRKTATVCLLKPFSWILFFVTMAASVHFRPQNRDLGRVMREVDEDLAVFLGMKNCEKEKNDFLVHDSNEFDHSKEPQMSSLSMPYDNFLNSEIEGGDNDWLLTPPDTSLLPSLEVGMQDSMVNQAEFPDCGSPVESKEPENSAEKLESSAVNRRPLSSGNRKSTSRQATPTRWSTLPAKSKPSRSLTPTSRATFPSTRNSAPVLRSSIPSKPAAKRSSTPAARPSMPVPSKSGSRSATPNRKPSTPSTTPGIAAFDRSSSGIKAGLMKNPVPSCGISPTVKSRPSKSSEIIGVSRDASQNIRSLTHKRPPSASRGRPSAPATQSSLVRSSSNEKPRRKSCSPTRAHALNGTANKNGSSILSKSRGHNNGGDDVNPVLIGTKMVERVVNMRKLAPPKQDKHVSHDNPRKSSQENSGFGRSLSKKSLDMAIRHMDITRSVHNSLRPVVTGTSALSNYGVRPSSANSSTVGVLESPLATNICSSELSINNAYFLDGSEVEDNEVGSQ
ncbi:flocculation protein FLO11-like isoform X2 [Olea europaea var. sylvestris]|uniref:flocculation protein FLO11-like isoform X2 n=1 Tax=Olea europaea var. sylvestris TaxID=158386 RepID=UPI000C1D2A81|nr:flocculation protein FLO11-like isoform X2 [Olea europaea var. sylvestris]